MADELSELRKLWQDVVDTLEVTPVIYNDDGKPIWAGKPLTGKGSAEKANEITEQKLKQYAEQGETALADSEPLDNILRAGELRVT